MRLTTAIGSFAIALGGGGAAQEDVRLWVLYRVGGGCVRCLVDMGPSSDVDKAEPRRPGAKLLGSLLSSEPSLSFTLRYERRHLSTPAQPLFPLSASRPPLLTGTGAAAARPIVRLVGASTIEEKNARDDPQVDSSHFLYSGVSLELSCNTQGFTLLVRPQQLARNRRRHAVALPPLLR